MKYMDLESTGLLIRVALHEDLAQQSDITTAMTVPVGTTAKAVMRTRQAGVLAGIEVAAKTFNLVDPSLDIQEHAKSGQHIEAGEELLTVEGLAASILTAERTALNFVTHLSGIATQTQRYVDAVKDTKAIILDTRKTLPGLRALQKFAVHAGGGENHRFGLFDAVLIKDNHIAMAGGIEAALEQVAENKKNTKIEIEVDTLEQLAKVLECGICDIVMLDNFSTPDLKKGVDMVDGKMLTEASGGVTLDTVAEIAETGVDYISVGALTHSVEALDIGLDIEL